MRLLTVSELAGACPPSGAGGGVDISRLRLWTRRLRHWTNLGLLPTAAKHREGAGQHRLYDPSTAYTAAVLLRIAATGASLPVITEAAVQLIRQTQGRRKFAQSWRSAIRNSDTVQCWLSVTIASEGERIYLTLYEGPVSPNGVDATEPKIIVNLSSIFSAVKFYIS